MPRFVRVRGLLIVWLLVIAAGCSDEGAGVVDEWPRWRRQRPASSVDYAARTLDRITGPAATGEWREPVWNASGTLELEHVRSGLVFVLLPRGRFSMGSAIGGAAERPAHEVEVASFLLSRTECTRAAWRRVGAGDPPGF